MGAGAALTLHNLYNLRHEFRNINRSCPGVVAQWRGRLILNVITKFKFFEKPTNHQMYCALQELRNYVLTHKITVIASTPLGTGKDRFPYELLLRFMYEIFQDVDVDFHFYHF
jgi:hypothetical protein